MSTIRLIAILLLASLAAGQQHESERSNIPEPKLPVIDYDACPGKSGPIPNVKLVKDALVYTSPNKGKLVAKLKAGEEVTVLAGANVIRQPDKAVIRYVSPDDPKRPPLTMGDTVFGYGLNIDGNMVFWAKGVWFQENVESVAEKGACGFSYFGSGGCTIDIVKDGVLEWWVQVKTSTGLTGWALAVRYNENNRWCRWQDNFYDVLQGHCSAD